MTPAELDLYNFLISTGVSPEEAEQEIISTRTPTRPSIPSGVTSASAGDTMPTHADVTQNWGPPPSVSPPVQPPSRGGDISKYPELSYPTKKPQTGNKWQFFPSAGLYGGWAEVPDPNYGKDDISSYIEKIQMERERLDLEKDRLDAQIAQNMRRDISDREAWEGKPKPSDVPIDDFGRKAFWDGSIWRYPPDWQTDPAKQKAGYISPAEQQRIAIEQQQLQQQMAYQQQQMAWQKEQQLASLRARPSSWLEYASLSGQAPVVQPWMTGLLPQGSNLAQGQTLPGFNPGAQKMDLPELTRPSQQYLARVGPVPTQQFYGYEQARTGAPPEQTAWYLSELSAPSGRFAGMSRRR